MDINKINEMTEEIFGSCKNCKNQEMEKGSWACFNGECCYTCFSYHDPIESKDQIRDRLIKDLGGSDVISRHVIFPIGISGCGKSTFQKVEYPNYTVIEPDQIRKEMTGSISDQSMNNEVFEEVHRRFIDALKKGENIYLSETHLNLRFLKDELELMKLHGGDKYRPIFILFDEASKNPELCRDRVASDISSGIERPATHKAVLSNGRDLLYKMAEDYLDLIKCTEFQELVKGNSVYEVDEDMIEIRYKFSK